MAARPTIFAGRYQCIRRNHRTSGFTTSPHQIHTQQGRASQAPPPASDSRTQSRLPGEIQLISTVEVANKYQSWPSIFIMVHCQERLTDLATTCPRFPDSCTNPSTSTFTLNTKVLRFHSSHPWSWSRSQRIQPFLVPMMPEPCHRSM